MTMTKPITKTGDFYFTTPQQVFNRVWQWFVTDDHAQARGLNGCSYRMENGERCAIGCCIPDDDRFEKILRLDEGDFSTLQDKFPDEVDEIFDGVPDSFLLDIQRCHDRHRFGEYKRDALVEFANDHQLTVPEIPV